MELFEIKQILQQKQYQEWNRERQDMINNIEFIENLEYQIREQFDKMNQEEPVEPEEGDMIFENENIDF